MTRKSGSLDTTVQVNPRFCESWLELIRIFKAKPLPKTVWLLATWSRSRSSTRKKRLKKMSWKVWAKSLNGSKTSTPFQKSLLKRWLPRKWRNYLLSKPTFRTRSKPRMVGSLIRLWKSRWKPCAVLLVILRWRIYLVVSDVVLRFVSYCLVSRTCYFWMSRPTIWMRNPFLGLRNIWKNTLVWWLRSHMIVTS